MSTHLLRLFLATVGRLSQGVQLCYSDGPTAGTTLAYAYRNEPHGRLIIGKWIDRRFLNHVGWQRARDRHAALQTVLRQNVADLTSAGLPIQILDLASGTADYLTAVFGPSSPPASAVCRDASEKCLATGRAWVAAAGIHDIRFELGDALDRPSILAIQPRPTLVLSVGLYELLDDDAFATSIHIAAQALLPGGRFIVVHQIGHSHPDVVSQLFRSPDRPPTKLYLRSPAQLASALQNASLIPTSALLCGQGWYTVTTARKDADGPGPL